MAIQPAHHRKGNRMTAAQGKKIPYNLGKKYKVRGTKKQQAVVQQICTGNKRSVAMRQAGYSESSIKNPAQNLSKKRGYREALEEYLMAFHNAGITPEFIADAIYDIRHAKKVVLYPLNVKFRDSGRMKNLRRVKAGSIIITPDYKTRVRALEIFFRLYGEYMKADQHN